MSFHVTATKSFLKELKEIKKTRSSILKHLNELDTYLTRYGIDHNIRHFFDIEPLDDGYFRFKFIPYRIIVHVVDTDIYFKKIFKRK